MSKILEVTHTTNWSSDSRNAWLDLVDSEYYKDHSTEVNAAASGAGWEASTSFNQFDLERKKELHTHAQDISHSQKLTDVFVGITDAGLAVVDHCLLVLGEQRPGITFLVVRNSEDGDVQILFRWNGLPGPHPLPFAISSSTLQNAVRTDVQKASIPDRFRGGASKRWEDAPRQGELVVRDLQLAGNSSHRMLLHRTAFDKPIFAKLYGPNFNEVFVTVEPHTKPVAYTKACSIKASQLLDEGSSALSLQFPPVGTKGLPLSCWNMEPGKTAVVSWSGTVLGAQFPSYVKEGRVDITNKRVDYVLDLRLLVEDVGEKELHTRVPLIQCTCNARDSHQISSGQINVTVPPSGGVLAFLQVLDSNLWPATLGPISISKDFTINVTAK